MKIIDTAQALPPSGRFVLAWLDGAEIPMRALWADKFSLGMSDEQDPEWGEYCEEKDEYFCPAGWYEMNQHEESHWRVDGNVVAWCELPRLEAGAAPAAVAGPAWDKTRDSLATLLLGLARRPFLDFDVACIALDAATEPGMPLAYMRGTPAAPALEAPAHQCCNSWFLSLPEGRQAVLRDNQWMLASAAYQAGRESSRALEAPAAPDCIAHVVVEASVYPKNSPAKIEKIHKAFSAEGAAKEYAEQLVESYNEQFPGYRHYGQTPMKQFLVQPIALAAAPQAPAAPVANPAATWTSTDDGLPEHGDLVLCDFGLGYHGGGIRFGYEVLKWDEHHAVADVARWMKLDRSLAAPAAPSIPQWIDDPHDIEQGQMLNPAWTQAQATGAVPVAEIMSKGYNGQVLWKGKVPPVGTLLYAAPQAAPAAPAVDAPAPASEWRDILTAEKSDDLIWLYDANSKTIDGPRTFGTYDVEEYTHWAPAEAPDLDGVDEAFAAAIAAQAAAKGEHAS